LKIVGILLAAGAASRFGGGKLLHRLPDGTPIGVASLRVLKSALTDVLAVVREGDDDLRTLLEAEGVRVSVCPDARQGMSRSLVCGISASPSASGWVLALGDMPYVLPATIQAVAAGIERTGGIVLPSYRGQRGNPVGFSARYRDLLLGVKGDEGARSVVQQHPSAVSVVNCDDPGILRDIDRREDLEKP
jgi:molybdenum cofactor cytidylyltransferase